ncbi:MAG: HD domain-containing protein [Myxococcales bacterium]|nr:HD domain-containing protein [Myxococcales bacterium]
MSDVSKLAPEQHALAAQLVSALSRVLQAARQGDVASDVVGEAVDEVRRHVQALTQGAGGLALSLAGERFVVNSVPLQLDFRAHRDAEQLRHIWESLGLGAIELGAKVEAAQLEPFVGAMMLCVRAPERAAQVLLGRTWPTGIAVRPPRRPATKLSAGALYAGLLLLAERAVACFAANTAPPTRHARRVMQRLVDALEDDESALVALTSRPERRDRLATHLCNTAVLSLVIGRRAGLERTMLVTLGMAALFHDLPKIGLNDRTLDSMEQPSRVSEQDRARIEQHWLATARKLVQLVGLSEATVARLVVLYESRLEFSAEGELSLLSRIVRLADAVDTAGWTRPGKPFIAAEQIIGALANHGARGDDAPLSRLFVAALGRYPAGSVVKLAPQRPGGRGELALVVSQGLGGDAARPMVRVCVDAAGKRCDGPDLDLAVDTSRAISGCVDAREAGVNVVAPHAFAPRVRGA